MNTDILAIIIMVFIAGIVITAWRMRGAKDKRDEWQKERPVISKKAEKSQMQIAIERLENQQAELSKKVEKSQMQIAIERLDNKQAELSKRLEKILEAQSKVTKPKAVKKRIQKTSPRKTISKPKKKKP